LHRPPRRLSGTVSDRRMVLQSSQCELRVGRNPFVDAQHKEALSMWFQESSLMSNGADEPTPRPSFFDFM